MDRNFARALAVTLQYEGGWSDNPRDPGGATMKGVTLGTFRRRKPGATKADLRAISDQDLAAIYRRDFWSAVNGDTLADGVDLVTFDAGVNSGPGRAKQWLMASIGGSNVETVKKVCARRLGFMQSLKIWKSFGKGWARRVASVEAKGVAWALGAVSTPGVVKGTLEREAKEAGKKAGNQAKGAGGAAVGGGGSATQVDLSSHTAIIIIALVAIAAGVLIWRAHINKTRASAFAAEAATI